MSTATLLHLRHHDKSCANCQYIRHHKTVAVTSECLLLGRTMAITPASESYWLQEWDRQRICDGWKRRPKSWVIHTEGKGKNPHWTDPYIPRETLIRIRRKAERDARRDA